MNQHKDIEQLWKKQDKNLDTNLKINKEKMTTLLNTKEYHLKNSSIFKSIILAEVSIVSIFLIKYLIQFWEDETIRTITSSFILLNLIIISVAIWLISKTKKLKINGINSIKKTQKETLKLIKMEKFGGLLYIAFFMSCVLASILWDINDASEFKTSLREETMMLVFVYPTLLICVFAYYYAGNKTELEKAKSIMDKIAKEG